MTTVTTLKQDNRCSYGIKVETDKQDFVIPVIDCRDGEEARKRTARTEKQVRNNRGSKFMKPSYSVMGNCYQVSHKKTDD